MQSGLECEQCEQACSKPRPPGCQHECLRKCHPGAVKIIIYLEPLLALTLMFVEYRV